MKKAVLVLLILAVAALPAQALIIKAGKVKFTAITSYDAGTTYPGVGAYTAEGWANCDLVANNCPGAWNLGGGIWEDTWAIIRIDQIWDNDTAKYWDSSKTEEVTALLYGAYDIYCDKPIAANDTLLLATGGKIDFYYDTTPDFDASGGPGARTGLTSYPTVTDGLKLFTLDLTNGCFEGTTGPGAATLLAADFKAMVDFGTLFGDGWAFGDVVPGSGPWAPGPGLGLDDNFDAWPPMKQWPAIAGTPGNWTYRSYSVDQRLQWDAIPDTTGWSWTVVNDDPIRGSYVPEPGSMALLGLGLLALVRRRRRTK